jgi:hypothetical protein
MIAQIDSLLGLEQQLYSGLQILLLEPERLERIRRAIVLCEVKQPLRGVVYSHRLGDARDGVLGERGVVCDCVREDHGVRFGVGHAEGAAEGVTDLFCEKGGQEGLISTVTVGGGERDQGMLTLW